MKFLIAFSVLLAVVACGSFGHHSGSTSYKRSHHFTQNVTEMIAENGYPVQNFTVQTGDGYLLDVIRVPGCPEYRRQFHHQLEKQQEREHHQIRVQTGKPAVLLMHSMWGSSEEFVIGGPTQGLAYILADKGFDVFMGNVRGSEYGQRHTALNPERDAVFWKFCWQDMGKKDLPAMIDAILKQTGQDKLSYVGYLQGSAIFYVMASEMPEYNDKINKMVSLGPIAYLGHTENTLLRYVADNFNSAAWQMKNLGINKFQPSAELLSHGGEQDCSGQGIESQICENVYFLGSGFSGADNLNMTTVNKYVERVPSDASARQMIHYADLVKSGRFQKYSHARLNQHSQGQSYSEEEIKEFDLSKISAPVYIVYAARDALIREQDVDMLVQKLPQVVENVKISEISSSSELIFAKNVDRVVYKRVVDMLRKD